jgi:hypothetical protein
MTTVRCENDNDLGAIRFLWSEPIAFHHDLDDRVWV